MITKLKQELKERTIGYNTEGVLRHYSVLVPLVMHKGQYHLLFEQRSQYISQSNDICFPGGKVEINETYEFASIRETSEELVIDSNQIEIIGPLDLYIAHDSILVHPYLGLIKDYQYTLNDQEVEKVHLIPLNDLLNHQPDVYGGKLTLQLDEDFPYSKISGGKNYPWRQGSRKILFYTINGITIWGMSAMILRNALEIIREI